jgi:hypothetical protein
VRGTRALLRILACCAALAVCAPPAHAGTYDVWGCRLPDGSPAPINGWAPSLNNGNGETKNLCGTPSGGITATVANIGASPGRDALSWTFTPPAGSTIDNFTLFRYVRIDVQDGRGYSLGSDFGTPAIERCDVDVNCLWLGEETAQFAPSNRIETAHLGARRLQISIVCNNSSSCPASTGPSVVVYASRMGLTDDASPQFRTKPTGSIWNAERSLEGPQTVRVQGRDTGSGVARIELLIDGVVRDHMSTGCQAPYVDLVPCAPTVDRTLGFDTAAVPDGGHTVATALIDGAGNRTASEPMVITTQNPGRPNGLSATRDARLRSWFRVGRRSLRSRTVLFGRAATVAGTLTTADGRPIRGAAIDVTATPRALGASASRLSPITTDAHGGFSFSASAGPSRTFQFAYRAFASDAAPAATAQVTLHVRAGVSLRVMPRRTTSRGRISFIGRLLGGPNRAGTQVQLFAVARKGRDRVPVATLRADRRGRFQFRYRFRRTFAPFTYYFRAVVERQNGYPYATGSSKRVSVRIVR